MIPLGPVLALAAVLAPRRAVELVSRLAPSDAADAARRVSELVERPRLDRAAALAASLRPAAPRASAPSPELAEARFRRDLAGWSRARTAGSRAAGERDTPIRITVAPRHEK